MNLTRRALFGLVAGLPLALKALAVEKPVTYQGVPVLYAENLEEWDPSQIEDVDRKLWCWFDASKIGGDDHRFDAAGYYRLKVR